jgi:lysophospholipase
MNSSVKAGLTPELPPTEWLIGAPGRLACSFYPAQEPWLNVIISHGLGEHRGWWHHVAQTLRLRGINTLTFDHYHHGRSDGTPADAPGYDVLSAGFELALTQGSAPRSAGQPIVLLAHSNGALVALRSLPAVHGRLAGAALCSPLLGIPLLTLAFAWPLARLLALRDPRSFGPLKPRPWRLTHDKSIWRQYAEDPLRFRRISARFFLAMAREARTVARRPSCDGLPLLLLSAGEDVVVSRAAMNRWYAGIQSPDKQRIHFPRARHELFNETVWADVLDGLAGWLAARWSRRN